MNVRECLEAPTGTQQRVDTTSPRESTAASSDSVPWMSSTSSSTTSSSSNILPTLRFQQRQPANPQAHYAFLLAYQKYLPVLREQWASQLHTTTNLLQIYVILSPQQHLPLLANAVCANTRIEEQNTVVVVLEDDVVTPAWANLLGFSTILRLPMDLIRPLAAYLDCNPESWRQDSSPALLNQVQQLTQWVVVEAILGMGSKFNVFAHHLEVLDDWNQPSPSDSIVVSNNEKGGPVYIPWQVQAAGGLSIPTAPWVDTWIRLWDAVEDGWELARKMGIPVELKGDHQHSKQLQHYLWPSCHDMVARAGTNKNIPSDFRQDCCSDQPINPTKGSAVRLVQSNGDVF